MAAVFPSNIRRKKRPSRDGGDSGMSINTKRHFDIVKQKLFAFVNQQHQLEADGNRLAPPVPSHLIAQRQFVDQNKALQPQLHHHRTPAPAHNHLHTPLVGHKHLHTPLVGHKQLPHIAFATPQVARRKGM